MAAPLPFRLYLITDRAQCGGRSLVDTLDQACHAGVRAIQIREKDLPPRDLIRLVLDIQRRATPYGVSLFVNDRVDVARITATGVHLPESGLPPDLARRCLPDGTWVGCSTHSLDSACLAEDAGADFITFGPVFFTSSKASYGPPQGLEHLQSVAEAVKIPVLAIGGITPDRVPACLKAGAGGVAVISAILAADDVAAAAAAFEAALGGL